MFVEALIRFLVAEHVRKPIQGKILALGKQSVSVSLSKIKEIFDEYNCEINHNFKDKIDQDTRYRSGNLDDESLFSMFGSVDYQTLDVSDYENASIVHNLNMPIPKELEGQFDFIVDGGTFDHLFDLKTCFENVTKLLKPGGRIFQWNAASNYANAGYLSFSADFFYDYYTLNKYADCRTFFAASHSMGAQNWCIYEFIPSNNGESYSIFAPSYLHVMVIVLAEKGKSTTFARMPVQLQYRDEELKNEYLVNSKNYSIHTTGPMKLKALPIEQIDLPERYKQLMFLEPGPCKKTYHKVGWV